MQYKSVELSQGQINKQQCKFCLQKQSINPAKSPLVSPCKCSGSQKYTHQSCLKQWIMTKKSYDFELKQNLAFACSLDLDNQLLATQPKINTQLLGKHAIKCQVCNTNIGYQIKKKINFAILKAIRTIFILFKYTNLLNLLLFISIGFVLLPYNAVKQNWSFKNAFIRIYQIQSGFAWIVMLLSTVIISLINTQKLYNYKCYLVLTKVSIEQQNKRIAQ